MKGFFDPVERQRRLGILLAVVIVACIVLDAAERYQTLDRIVMLLGGLLSVAFGITQREHGQRWWEVQFTLGLGSLLVVAGRFLTEGGPLVMGMGLGFVLGPIAVALVNRLLRQHSEEG